ncbi:CD70 antigen [Rhynchocyon petersi]
MLRRLRSAMADNGSGCRLARLAWALLLAAVFLLALLGTVVLVGVCYAQCFGKPREPLEVGEGLCARRGGRRGQRWGAPARRGAQLSAGLAAQLATPLGMPRAWRRPRDTKGHPGCGLHSRITFGIPKPGEAHMAELQLNNSGMRQDPRLHWQGGPALGRSFLRGPVLRNGQLHVQQDGIYQLHIQVTLTNCSSTWKTESRKATLAVGICAPITHQVSLLRLSFYPGCTVASQHLTPLARGDVLCTNLTLPLQPSPNADETFFGIQWLGF